MNTVSPLSKIKVVSNVGVPPGELRIVQSSNQGKSISVFNNSSSPVIGALSTAVQMSDIDNLGQDVSRQIGATTDKIIKKMTVGNFDELGSILTAVQLEADKLSPASYQKKGLIRWFKNKFTDIKKELTLNFKTAEQVFDKLEKQISDHIAVHAEWIKDLDQLYNENYSRYQQLMKVMEMADAWEASIVKQLETWPEIDTNSPDAAMQVQAKRDVESLLNRLQSKKDYFLRLKTILENHSPRIRDQQETSRTTISTLKDVVEQAIPAIKSEFTLFLQSLDSQKSNEMITNLRGLVNTTLQKSADTAYDAAISSATNAVTPTFSTDTIKHIRNKMISTVTEVKRIQSEAEVRRKEDAQYIMDSQKEYLNQCVQLGAVK